MSICVFFNDTATTEIYTLSLRDALPICGVRRQRVEGALRSRQAGHRPRPFGAAPVPAAASARYGLVARSLPIDRKSTRLNSSHANISYAVFCLKKYPSPRIPADPNIG